MKRIFFIILILAYCIQGQAKTLRIDYLSDTIRVTIDSKSVDAFNVEEFIGIQIDSIHIYELKELQQTEPHKICINGRDITTINAKKQFRKKIRIPFTILRNDNLSAYKSDKMVGHLLFKKPIDKSDIQNSVCINPIYPNNGGHFILKSESDTLHYMLNNPEGYLIDSIFIYDSHNEPLGSIKYNSESGKIGIPITLKNATDSAIVHLVVTCPMLSGTEIPIKGNSIVLYNKSRPSSIIGALGLMCVILLGIGFFFIWRKKATKRQCENASTEDENPQLVQADSTEENKNVLNDNNINDQNEVPLNGDEESSRRIAEYLNTISDLQKLLNQYADREARNVRLLREKDGQIRELEDTVSRYEQLLREEKADKTEKRELRDKISKLNCKIRELTTSIDKNEKLLRSCRETLKSAESSAVIKDKRISELNGEKDQLTSRLKEEQSKSSDLIHRLNGFSKQSHYLYLIDETLSNIEKNLPLAFENVTDETLRRKLVDPVVIGTPGLDETGMESYKATWLAEVYDNQVAFFGKDVLMLSDAEVVNTLRDKFIENLAMRDSFNKLVRLYLFSNVGWLNIKLVEAGFNIDAIQTLFIELKNLFDRFGVEISYPHLFIDIFDETQYRDSRRCDIFSIFEPTPEVQAMMRAKSGESLIVDLVRIGLPHSNTQTRRIPMVSLPNF